MKKIFIPVLFAALAIGSTSTMTSCNKDGGTTTTDTPNNNGVVTVTGDISSNTTWDANKKYLLKGFVYVTNGATLTIPAGTIVMGDKATKGTLCVTRGSKLMAEGTAAKPIIFTSAQAAGARREGDWGGVILLGKSTVNPSGGEAKIEGGLVPTNGGDEKKYIWYGGSDANDNSGTIKYARIEFAGIAYSPDNEINGLTMGGVGAGTTISYVQVYRSGDDAYEWFGGTVNCDHLIATASWDDDFDTDFGFSGRVQFGLAQRVKTIADQSGSNGFESDNDGNGSSNLPQTKAMFSNMTIIGPVATKTTGASGINANFQHGAQIRRNSSESILNSIITGFPYGLYIDDSKGLTSDDADAGTLMFKNNILAGNSQQFRYASSWTNATTWFASTNTTQLDSAQMVMLTDPYKFSSAVSASVGRPNFLPVSGSIAFTKGTTYAGTSGFENVNYIGAFGTTDWTAGWTNWEPENTQY